MSERQLTVVIVHWNQSSACAQTVARFCANPHVVRLIVVDNGSSSDELAALRTSAAMAHPGVELLEVGTNSGFGPGVNRGWETWLANADGTEWVAVAPHDAQPQDGALGALLDATENASESGQPYGLLSADVGDGASPFVDHVFGPITRPATSTNGVEAVDYPHGTLMLASRTCLERIGLFDERFFSYCEEADLGLRAQAAGFAVGLVRGARVVNPTSTPRRRSSTTCKNETRYCSSPNTSVSARPLCDLGSWCGSWPAVLFSRRAELRTGTRGRGFAPSSMCCVDHGAPRQRDL